MPLHRDGGGTFVVEKVAGFQVPTLGMHPMAKGYCHLKNTIWF